LKSEPSLIAYLGLVSDDVAPNDIVPIDPTDPEAVLDAFVDWVTRLGLELFPAQEEGILALTSGSHVILDSPTGSGKSMVAVAMHFFGLAAGKRSFYTSPIKALVSEKFFDLCRIFGAERVGMLTGDASINPNAPIICCTAEVLSNMALRQGNDCDVGMVCMDEFHYYADRDRGISWQIPLLVFDDVQFLLMSATLGDMTSLIQQLEGRTSVGVEWVQSTDRPVPLEFSYSEYPIHETVEDLVREGKQPVYVVQFTQRACAEQAQALTSTTLCSAEEKKSIAHELRGIAFDSPYGKTIRKYVSAGIGLHHAGLLPRYRLLVEKLAQRGLLKVIVGTDTLGVGINVPIRTVLFAQLCKYDGQKVRLLRVREFKQIAGRAGRKGFDNVGYVVAQAPAHAIENLRAESKAAQAGRKKYTKSKPPERGFVNWNNETFEQLRNGKAEELQGRFALDHAVVLQLLQRNTSDTPLGEGYTALVKLIECAHVEPGFRPRLRRRARSIFKSLLAAGIIATERRPGGGSIVAIHGDLPEDFSLFYTLSLYALDTLDYVSPESEGYPLKVLTVLEAILEDPNAVLYAQVNRLKGDLVAQLKAEGVEYDQRMEVLEKVTHPRPEENFLTQTYYEYTLKAPWAQADSIKPKSVARDLYERYLSFNEYVRYYGLERSEGVLLRYLSMLYKAFVQTVPESFYDDGIIDMMAFLRAILERADSSLLVEWESLRYATPEADLTPSPLDISRNPRAFAARVRAELHAFLRALAAEDYEEALLSLRAPTNGDEPWTEERIKAAILPFTEDRGPVRFDHEARLPPLTMLVSTDTKRWSAKQFLLDEERSREWCVECTIDLRQDTASLGPIIELVRISD